MVFTHPVTLGHNAFVYVIEGEALFGPANSQKKVTAHSLGSKSFFVLHSLIF